MTIGIDKIGFATGRYRLDLKDLAQARQVDPAKFEVGLMLDSMSISPANEDIVTLAAAAARDILTEDDKKTIDLVIVATETGIDQSKSASVFVHQLLGIQPFARSIEMKQACYSATAALDYAQRHIERFPQSKVLVIASDMARYGIKAAGEPTQGVGALALLITSQPRILAFNNDNLALTRDIMDFWRPNYSNTPYVQGALSTQSYLESLATIWEEHQRRYATSLDQLAAICFHVPFPKQAFKGMESLLTEGITADKAQELRDNFTASISYNRQVGNIYTGSLYLSLLSLLENSRALTAGDNIGFYSYGSGAVSEFYTGYLVEGFEQQLKTNRQDELNQRISLSVYDYEKIFYADTTPDQEGNADIEQGLTAGFALTGIEQHQRRYQEVSKND